jgi:hypothetical protein
VFLDLPKTTPEESQAAVIQKIFELQQQSNQLGQDSSSGFYPSREGQQLQNHVAAAPKRSTRNQTTRALLSRPAVLPEAFLERLLDTEEQYATLASYDSPETTARLRCQVLCELATEFNLDRDQQTKARKKWDEVTPLNTQRRRKLKREVEKRKGKARGRK